MKKFSNVIEAMHYSTIDGSDTFKDYVDMKLGAEGQMLEDSIFEKTAKLISNISELNDFEMEVGTLGVEYEKIGFRAGFILGVRLMTEVFCHE